MAPKDTVPATDIAIAPPNAEEQAALESVRNALSVANMDAQQVMSIIRELPPAWAKSIAQAVTRQQNEAQQGSNSTEAAAETLSNLAQQAAAAASQHQASSSTEPPVDPSILPQPQDGQEPGPNSHPNGPPMLGFSARDHDQPEGSKSVQSDGADDAAMNLDMGASPGRKRANPLVGTDEWRKQRKINHKEVERRRRGNINYGIDELARIVPNGTGEKAKGAILSRAVQYILHLKENEARNIEKWTLEKLLMDQAMGDLQIQLDEYRKLAEEERRGREAAEAEAKALKEAMEKMSSVIGRKRNVTDVEEEGNGDTSTGATSDAAKKALKGKKQKTAAS